MATGKKRFNIYYSKNKRIPIRIPVGIFETILNKVANADGISTSEILIKSFLEMVEKRKLNIIEKDYKKYIKENKSLKRLGNMKQHMNNDLQFAHTTSVVRNKIFDMAFEGVNHMIIYNNIQKFIKMAKDIKYPYMKYELEFWNYLKMQMSPTRCGAYRKYIQDMKFEGMNKEKLRNVALDIPRFFIWCNDIKRFSTIEELQDYPRKNFFRGVEFKDHDDENFDEEDYDPKKKKGKK